MNTFKRNLLFLAITLAISLSLSGQGNIEDYRRADSLSGKFRNKVFFDNVQPVWAGESAYFTYENNTPDGREYVLVDPINKTKTEAFSTSRFARALAKQLKKEIEPAHLPISGVKFADNLKSFTFLYNDIEWTCDLPSYKLTSGERSDNRRRFGQNRSNWAWATRDENSNEPVESPDKKMTAFIKNFNVYIKDADGKELQLSFDGGTGSYYSSYMYWSPDSKKIMAYKVQPAEKHFISYIESSPEDQLQPKYYTYEYTKPGDALPQFFPQIFDVVSGSHIKVDESLYPNQYSLGRFKWKKNSSAISFEYNKRGHQVYQLINIDAATGEQNVIVDERSDTFIDYSGKRYRYDVNDGEEIIWASERDGWNHLYLIDGNTGEVKNQITSGNWVVRDVEYVDEENRQIIFMASGKEEGDPYHIDYYSIGFDGRGLKRLSAGYGTHSASFSPDYKYFVDTYSTIDTPPVSVLRKTITGAEIMPLEKADISALVDAGWRAPEVFAAKGRDGITDIWGIIIRPTNFDPAKSYPVIEDIYAGPHSSFVPKNFRSYLGGMQALAELGFIIVKIDGMGTSNRSKAFHDVCFKNLKDAGFPDRILWMKEAASKYPYMDIARVGVYGTSAGGQSSTGAVLFHPEFYKVAVSACGCHDNRMDKIWWNEQWMGWPVGPEYAESSNVDNAYRLEGKLLLINGEMDNNVDPRSTEQVVNALIKANKDFDYLFVPGMRHSSGGEYGEHKRRDFFVKHLLGVDPPEWE
ncbi:MAG: DPP IV N-terminal domain-containing protein [Marinilabiliaceae bacterium]|jgi:dipeptidyl aminopeptidase/acylaminoacyl peptidase|nr:DPP IV N-terminal domain-containing protein [Marinilabiliaceae bacterium]